MKHIQEIGTKIGLKRLMEALLVFVLISFSGHSSSFRVYASEPIRIELNEARTFKIQRATQFNNATKSVLSTFLPRTEHFISAIFCYENKVSVQSKIKIPEKTTTQRDGFLSFHATGFTEEYDHILLKG